MKIRILAVWLLLLPATAFACSTFPDPTDIPEPVTVKVAGTYFQVPEKYLTYSFYRVPMEHNQLEFANIMLKGETKPARFSIVKTKDSRYGGYLRFNDDIAFNFSRADDRSEKIIAYLKTISSQEAPTTWAEDSRLASSLGVGRSAGPCGMSRIKTNPPYEDILEGVSHRNQEIRAGAAYAFENGDFLNKKGAKEILVRLSTADASPRVRSTATMSLGKLIYTDASLVPILIEIMTKDINETVRETASHVLPDAGPAFVPQVLPLIHNSDILSNQLIGKALVWFINKEVEKSHLVAYSQLSDPAKAALSGIVKILSETADSEIRQRLINPLRNSKKAVASEEYVKTLNRILLEGDYHTTSLCAAALSEVDAGTENIPLLIKRLSESTDVKEIGALIAALGDFKAAAKEAVPILVKYTSYRRDAHIRSQDDEMVRWGAIDALQAIRINTPEVVAALQDAISKETGNTKAQAQNALETILDKNNHLK